MGQLVDHGVDAVFVAAGSAALATRGVLPPLLPVAIALAFAQYASDARGGSLRPNALGRWNGIAYYVALAVPLVRDALGLGWPGPALLHALGWVLVATTALSIATRLRRG